MDVSDKEISNWKQCIALDNPLELRYEVQAAIAEAGFRERAWPELIRTSLQQRNMSCFEILCEMVQDNAELYPLPPDSLSIFLENDRHSVRVNGWSEWCQSNYEPLTCHMLFSPQIIAPQDWEFLWYSSGWWLGTGINHMEEGFGQVAWYQEQKSLYLNTDRGVEEVVRFLGDETVNHYWDQSLEVVWGSLPKGRKDEFLVKLTHAVQSKNEESKAGLIQIISAYQSIHSLAPKKAGQLWRPWWENFTQPSLTIARTDMILDSIRLLRLADKNHAPKGLAWDESFSFRLGQAVGDLLATDVQSSRIGFQQNHEKACFGIMEIENTLSGWGLWKKEIEEAFHAGLSDTRAQWEQLLTTPTANLLASDMYMEVLNQWKSARLVEKLTQVASVSAPPPAPKPKF